MLGGGSSSPDRRPPGPLLLITTSWTVVAVDYMPARAVFSVLTSMRCPSASFTSLKFPILSAYVTK